MENANPVLFPVASFLFPSVKVKPLLDLNGSKTAKFCVGLSVVISAATIPSTVKVLPLPLLSCPIVCPAVLANCNLNPFVPYVIDDNDLGIHLPVDVSVIPNVEGVNADPSTTLNSARYPSKGSCALSPAFVLAIVNALLANAKLVS